MEVVGPEIEKFSQARIIRRPVEPLPDKGLQQTGMVGQVIENFRRGQPIAVQLFSRIVAHFKHFPAKPEESLIFE